MLMEATKEDEANIPNMMKLYCKGKYEAAIGMRQKYEWKLHGEGKRDLGDHIYKIIKTTNLPTILKNLKKAEQQHGDDQGEKPEEPEEVYWIPNFLCLLYILGMWKDAIEFTNLMEKTVKKAKEIDIQILILHEIEDDINDDGTIYQPSLINELSVVTNKIHHLSKPEKEDYLSKANEIKPQLQIRLHMDDIPSSCDRLKNFQNLEDLEDPLLGEGVVLSIIPQPLYTDKRSLKDRIKQEKRKKTIKGMVAITAAVGVVWALIKISKTRSDKKYRRRRRSRAYKK